MYLLVKLINNILSMSSSYKFNINLLKCIYIFL
jgi:hypothetical protein